MNLNELKSIIKGLILTEAKKSKSPSTGLSKKKKSNIIKKARAGKDIGKKGKGFNKIVKSVEKQGKSFEDAKKIAGAAMWKGIKREAEGIEDLDIEQQELNDDINPNMALSQDEIGKFFFVMLPHRYSTCEDIVKNSSLLEYSELVRNGEIQENEIAGIYRNENKAKRLAQELLRYRHDVIKEINNQKVGQKQKEIDDLKALIAAAEAYYSLKPNLDPEVGGDKLDQYKQELLNKEKELEDLNNSIIEEEEKMNKKEKPSKSK